MFSTGIDDMISINIYQYMDISVVSKIISRLIWYDIY